MVDKPISDPHALNIIADKQRKIFDLEDKEQMLRNFMLAIKRNADLALADFPTVAEGPTDKMMIEHLDGQIQTLLREQAEIEAATIERCAQVAEGKPTDEISRGIRESIAAAIRGLKEPCVEQTAPHRFNNCEMG